MLNIKTNVTVVDTENTMAFLENDFAIVRGVTIGLVDFSNPQTFDGVDYVGVTIPALTKAKSLVFSGGESNGTANTNPLVGGINANNTVNLVGAANRYNFAKADFWFPDDATRVVFIMWANIPSAGYPNSSNSFLSILGDTNGTSDNYGAILGNFTSSSASAVLTALRLNVFKANISLDAVSRAAVTDELCQIAFDAEKVGSALNWKIYKNGVVIESGTTTFNVAPDSGGSAFSVGGGGSFNSDAIVLTAHGRINTANLSARPDITSESYILRDFNQARSFFGI